MHLTIYPQHYPQKLWINLIGQQSCKSNKKYIFHSVTMTWKLPVQFDQTTKKQSYSQKAMLSEHYYLFFFIVDISYKARPK